MSHLVFRPKRVQRGAAFIEALAVAGVFATLMAGILVLHGAYATKVDTVLASRRDAWVSANVGSAEWQRACETNVHTQGHARQFNGPRLIGWSGELRSELTLTRNEAKRPHQDSLFGALDFVVYDSTAVGRSFVSEIPMIGLQMALMAAPIGAVIAVLECFGMPVPDSLEVVF
jgi:hypothetical protein